MLSTTLASTLGQPIFLIPAVIAGIAIILFALSRTTALWAIIRNTFLQTIRQPLFTILVALLYVLLILGFMLSNWTISPSSEHQDSDQRLMINVSLSTLMTMGLLVAVFSASSVLSREIDDKTALTVISKPIRKGTFVLGKFLGVAGAVTIACYLGTLVMLMLIRHRVLTNASDPTDWPVIVLGGSAIFAGFALAMLGNFLFGWTFTAAATWLQIICMTVAMAVISVIGKGWQPVPFGQGIDPATLKATYALLLVIWLLTAVAIAASTRLGQIGTLMVCIGFAIAGGYHQLFFSAWAGGNTAVKTLGLVMPDTQYFLLMESILRDAVIHPAYLFVLTGYAVLLIGAVLALGIGLFQTRQLEALPSATGPGGVNLVAGVGRVVGFMLICVSLLGLASPERTWLTRIGMFSAYAVLGGLIWSASGALGRGRAWSYMLLVAVSLAGLGVALSALAAPDAMRFVTDRLMPGQIAIAAVLSAVMLLICGLPSTRRHIFMPS